MISNRQWSARPSDERFWSVQEMTARCREYAQTAVTAVSRYRGMRAEADGDNVVIRGANGGIASPTHYAFGQLAARAGAPAGYLRRLPAPLAAACLNQGLATREDDEHAHVLLHRTPTGLILRAALSEQYTRLWNYQVGEYLSRLVDTGWRLAPARPHPAEKAQRLRRATPEDCGEWTLVHPGEVIGPAGCYASDHDLHVFLIDPNRPIDDGSGKPLFRGAIFWNSETGDASLGALGFLYERTCGNHIILGGRLAFEVRLRHVGLLDAKARVKLYGAMSQFCNRGAVEEPMILEARGRTLGRDRAAVIEAAALKTRESRGRLEAAYDIAAEAGYDPQTVWGMVQGLTRASQNPDYADERFEADRAAARLLTF